MTALDSWNNVRQLMNSAYTRQEIEAAAESLRKHLILFPDDRERDPWHGWSVIVEAAEERHGQAQLLGLSNAQEAEREAVLRASYVNGDAFSDPLILPEMQAALASLSRWLLRHPEDRLASERYSELTRDIQLILQGQELIRQADSALVTA